MCSRYLFHTPFQSANPGSSGSHHPHIWDSLGSSDLCLRAVFIAISRPRLELGPVCWELGEQRGRLQGWCPNSSRAPTVFNVNGLILARCFTSVQKHHKPHQKSEWFAEAVSGIQLLSQVFCQSASSLFTNWLVISFEQKCIYEGPMVGNLPAWIPPFQTFKSKSMSLLGPGLASAVPSWQHRRTGGGNSQNSEGRGAWTGCYSPLWASWRRMPRMPHQSLTLALGSAALFLQVPVMGPICEKAVQWNTIPRSLLLLELALAARTKGMGWYLKS